MNDLLGPLKRGLRHKAINQKTIPTAPAQAHPNAVSSNQLWRNSSRVEMALHNTKQILETNKLPRTDCQQATQRLRTNRKTSGTPNNSIAM